MNYDLLGSVELTASAGIVVAIVAAGLGGSTRTRAAVAAAFGVWFSMVTMMAWGEVLHGPGVARLAGIGLTVSAPILIMVGAALASGRVRQALRRIPISSLVGLHTVRVLGLSFVVLYAQGRLPATFALSAGWGDIAIGATAPLVAWLVSVRGANARGVLTLWNSLGLLDLIVAIGLGVTSSPAFHAGFSGPDSGLMTTLPWLLIPGFLVPTLAATHLAIFYRLRVGLETSASTNTFTSTSAATSTPQTRHQPHHTPVVS